MYKTSLIIVSVNHNLFHEESTYTFKNIKIRDVNVNAKSLLYFLYQDIYFDRLDINNVKCVGDSILLLIDSGEEKKSISLKNSNIKHCLSNKSLIKIIGNSNNITMENIIIEYNISYGSIIKNESENV